MVDPRFYEGREQTFVKHDILEKYLLRFSLIIGSWADTITYVDCFTGPWESRDPAFSDTSFSLALNAFREARAFHAARGRQIKLRFLFLEKDRKSFAKLKRYLDTVTDVEVLPLNKDLESAVGDILQFVGAAGPNSFTFTFIDPTGWSGFPLDVIQPLLQIDPGEVLINFMTEHIRRFIETGGEQFHRMYGGDVPDLASLTGLDRDDEALRGYMNKVKQRGAFRYVGLAIVLKPEVEKTHFHLLYATRNDTGIEKFKEVERLAMRDAEGLRADAKRRKAERETGQGTLLGARDMYPSRLLDELRDRYTQRAKTWVRKMIDAKGSVSYDLLWRGTLTFPLVWENDLRDWLKEWQRDVRIVGMAFRERVPSRGKGITVEKRSSR